MSCFDKEEERDQIHIITSAQDVRLSPHDKTSLLILITDTVFNILHMTYNLRFKHLNWE